MSPRYPKAQAITANGIRCKMKTAENQIVPTASKESFTGHSEKGEK